MRKLGSRSGLNAQKRRATGLGSALITRFANTPAGTAAWWAEALLDDLEERKCEFDGIMLSVEALTPPAPWEDPPFETSGKYVANFLPGRRWHDEILPEQRQEIEEMSDVVLQLLNARGRSGSGAQQLIKYGWRPRALDRLCLFASGFQANDVGPLDRDLGIPRWQPQEPAAPEGHVVVDLETWRKLRQAAESIMSLTDHYFVR